VFHLNILYTLWFDKRIRHHHSRDVKKRKLEILKQFLLSLYTVYQNSGCSPIVYVYIAKKDKYFVSRIKQLHELVHEIRLVNYIKVPWCTKVLCFIEAFKRLNHFLYLDSDVKIIKKLPIYEFNNETLKFMSFGPFKKNINMPRLSSSMFKKSKKLRNYIIKTMQVPNYIGQVCSGTVFMNKDGQYNFDFNEYSRQLLLCLAVLQRKPPIRPFIQDQIIFTSALLKMGFDNHLRDFMFSPSLFYKARRSNYFIHWADLSRKRKNYEYSWRKAKLWYKENSINIQDLVC